MENIILDKNSYQGFEQGPIRPPSEAYSLLLRLTRNCPWNQCTFCRVYTNRKFSFRPVEHIIRDIDIVHEYIEKITDEFGAFHVLNRSRLAAFFKKYDIQDETAFHAALNWYLSGMEGIFLQDANSLILKPEKLIRILEHIRKCFPQVQRITTYARSHTIARISDEHLARMASAGLNRIHVGMETGSDKVLKRIKKGVDKQTHITAGLKVKQAGMELSEYIMPGLGGMDLSVEHALESASALNSINPDFIRLRTLAVTRGTVLADEEAQGDFEKPTDTMIAKEIRMFLEALDQITSIIKSDHILNLFETIEGKFPQDKERLIGIIDDFFALSPEDQVRYQVGRRMGFFRGPEDMKASLNMEQVRNICTQHNVTSENVDTVIKDLMERFV